MRISDWSSDVCSSDLPCLCRAWHGPRGRDARGCAGRADRHMGRAAACRSEKTRIILTHTNAEEIGRASCRERVCQYVSISVVAVSLNKKQSHKQNKPWHQKRPDRPILIINESS